jgi:hypothetical protein
VNGTVGGCKGEIMGLGEFWTFVLLVVLITKGFKLLEQRAKVPPAPQQPASPPDDYLRLEKDVQVIRQEIIEMRSAYTESIVELQAEVRYLRNRLENSSPPVNSQPDTQAETAREPQARNLSERAGWEK